METHLYFSERVDDQVTIATFNTRLQNKLKKAALAAPDQVKIESEDAYGELVAVLPKNLLSINIKTPRTRARKQMTDEEKAAFVSRTRAAKARKAEVAHG